ncbi:MAG: hypothetical protein LBM60_01290 [Clostridium sp.]|jgi:hypothetical protein|nr:hypothetical protein [Clostridium sp.]
MNVNGITSNPTPQPATNGAATPKPETPAPQTPVTTTQTNQATQPAALYEPSEVQTPTAGVQKYKPNTELLNKLKADADARTEQLRGIVEKMMSKQADAYGKANDIWKFLASGNYTVDAETKLQAQKDIADDGYWGVEQTASRIVDFAKALTGDDPDKIEEMRAAFEKGFKQATKAWGSDLPDISQQTYDAVMKKFDELAGISTTEAI